MKVKNGDKIKVDYEGSFDDGEVFDSSTYGDHSHPLAGKTLHFKIKVVGIN